MRLDLEKKIIRGYIARKEFGTNIKIYVVADSLVTENIFLGHAIEYFHVQIAHVCPVRVPLWLNSITSATLASSALVWSLVSALRKAT